MTRSLFARVLSAALILVGCATSVDAAGKKTKLDIALQQSVRRGETGSLDVIISAVPGRRDAVRAKLTVKGRNITGEHGSINALSATIDVRDLADLNGDPSVASVSLNAVVRAHQTVPSSGALLTLDLLRPIVGSPATGVTGRGVGVAVIDSGLANVPDLRNQIKAFYDFTIDGTARQASASDAFGHGTHIAATIASSGQQNGLLYQGIAPGVRLIGMKVLDASGNGSTSAVINALAFATRNKAALGIDVINLSLGHPIYESVATDPLVKAVEAAVHAGIVVVASAGNYGLNPSTGLPGYGGITSPGNAPSAITVGAVGTFGTLSRSDDRVAPYSSRGPSWFDGFAKPDLVAPGHRVVADVSNGYLFKNYPTAVLKASSGNYMRLSGSSMAAAVVSGVAALVLDANRTTLEADGTRMAPLNPYAVKAILQYTATPLAAGDALTQGSGEINAAGAVALTRALDTRSTPWTVSAVSSSTTFGSETNLWSTNIIWGAARLQNLTPDRAVGGANAEWSDNIIWGTNIEWSDNIIWGTDFVWGDNIIWGTNIEWGDNIIWGTNIVWDDNIIWGTNIAWGDNIIWGTSLLDADNIIWGTSLQCGTEVCF
jgi:serine protease AprX